MIMQVCYKWSRLHSASNRAYNTVGAIGQEEQFTRGVWEYLFIPVAMQKTLLQ